MESFSDHVDQFSALYWYTPTTWICILFVVLHSFTTLVHLAQATRSPLPYVLSGLFEIIGRLGRLWNSYDVQDIDPFIIQCILCWSQMRNGSSTPSQDLDHHYRATIPHCGRLNVLGQFK